MKKLNKGTKKVYQAPPEELVSNGSLFAKVNFDFIKCTDDYDDKHKISVTINTEKYPNHDIFKNLVEEMLLKTKNYYLKQKKEILNVRNPMKQVKKFHRLVENQYQLLFKSGFQPLLYVNDVPFSTCKTCSECNNIVKTDEDKCSKCDSTDIISGEEAYNEILEYFQAQVDNQAENFTSDSIFKDRIVGIGYRLTGYYMATSKEVGVSLKIRYISISDDTINVKNNDEDESDETNEENEE